MEKDLDKRVLLLARKLAGKKFTKVLSSAETIKKSSGKSSERSLAEALEAYGLGGSYDSYLG